MRIKDLFNPVYGTNLELNKCEQTEESDGINFVSRSSENNGVTAYVKPVENKQPHPPGVLTCAAGSSSVLSTFVQPKPFYTGRDVYILTPKKKMTLQEKLFYCMCIKNNAYRYYWDRQANKTLKDIELPDEIPEWVYKTEIEPIKTTITNIDHSFNTNNWKEFKLDSLFDPIRGKRLIKLDRIQGNTPFITAGYENEGLAEKIGNSEIEIYQNKVTIDMFCNAFYREYTFACDDNILVLDEKEDTPTFNKYTGLFIATIINSDRYKYQYGRQYRQKNFYRHLIKLPATSSGDPDWQFMENYIKLLPFADKI